jgi:DNA-binding XRE family transcriptional regulator
MTPDDLKAARARLDFSQERLAFELGVNRLSIVRWETGIHRIPPMLTLAIKYLEAQTMPSARRDRLLGFLQSFEGRQ